MNNLSETEKQIRDMYFEYKAKIVGLKLEIARIQEKLNLLDDVCTELELVMTKADCKHIYEHFEKLEKVQEGNSNE